MEHVIGTLTAFPYLLGEKFSGADVLYATTFGIFGSSPMLPKSPAIESYVKHCLDRPAYARAMERDSG